MSAQLPDVKSVFEHAVEIESTVDRQAFVDEACAGHPELREKVAALLKAYGDAGSFLEAGPRELAPTEALIIERAGSVIGPYKLLQQIGEGGFGVVYMAEQTVPVRRKVALKIIKPGMDTKEVIARFEAERQALALMDHPNIAKVLDGGATATGRPYFVMELVKGVPLTEFCDVNRRDTRERLRLFVSVCKAIQHAHLKGVIHRDVKPSNVLVTLHDGAPVPKVIDFGVAKSITQELTTRTIFTAYGQMIGTPQYMSPEQAEMSGLDIDTRTDIYSLGVLLYELLTGTTPLELKSLRDKAYGELQRLIREQEAVKPSFRLTTLGELSATVATQRGTDVKKLSTLLRGELDWIVLKALEKNRDRRYATATGLASDVERYLNHEAVEACPPSLGYKFRKFALRNRSLLATSAVLILILLTATLYSARQAIRATQAEGQTRDALVDVVQERNRASKERDRAVAAEATAKAEAEKATTLSRERQAALRDAQAAEQKAERRYYAAQMNLASQAWHSGRHARTVQLLETLRPAHDEDDLRGFEWFHLYHLSHANVINYFRAHTSRVHDIVWSTDGSWFASASWDASPVRFWDGKTGQPRGAIAGDWGTIWDLALSGDGTILAAATSTPAEVVLFDPMRRRVLRRWLAHPESENGTRAVALSPDGQLVATCGDGGGSDPSSDQGIVKLWAIDGQLISILSDQLSGVGPLEFSPDGSLLVSGDYPWATGKRLTLWSIKPVPRQLAEITNAGAYGLGFSEDGKTLWASEYDLVREIDTSGFVVRNIHAGQGGLDLRIVPGKNQLITLADERTIQAWDFKTGQTSVLGAELSLTEAFATNPQGTRVACGDHHGWITLRDLEATSAVPNHGAPSVNCLAFTPDNRQLLAGGSPIQTLDAETLARETNNTHPDGTIIAISPNGDLLCSYDGTSRGAFWDRSSNSVVLQADFGLIGRSWSNGTYHARLSSDGRYFFTARPFDAVDHDYCQVWDAQTGALLDRIHLSDANAISVTSCAFSPDSSRLAVGLQFSRVSIYDVATRTKIDTEFVFGPIVSVSSIAFSPDGRLLAAGGEDGKLILFDVDSDTGALTLRQQLEGHQSAIRAIAFSPDSTALVSAAAEGSVRFWDVALGQERATLDIHASLLAFSPRGSRLAIVDGNDSVSLLKASDLASAKAYRTWREYQDPASPHSLLTSARNTLQKGEPRQAETLLHAAIKELESDSDAVNDGTFPPQLVVAYRTLSEMYEDEKRADEAQRVFGKALERANQFVQMTPGNTYALRLRASVYAASRSWREKASEAEQSAIRDELTQIATDHPGLAHVQEHCGRLLYAIGYWNEATELLHRALKLDRERDFGLNGFQLAMAYHHAGQADLARKWYYASCLSMQMGAGSGNPFAVSRAQREAAALLGFSAEVAQSLEAISAEALQEAIALLPYSMRHRAMGIEPSKIDLELQVAFTNSHSRNKLWGAAICIWTKRFAEHSEFCEQMLADAETSVDAWQTERCARAILLHPAVSPNLLRRGAAMARRAAELHEDTWTRGVMGMAEYRQGNLSEAVTWLEKAVGTNNSAGRAQALAFQAMVAFRQGDVEKAHLFMKAADRGLGLWAAIDLQIPTGAPLVEWIVVQEARSLIYGETDSEDKRISRALDIQQAIVSGSPTDSVEWLRMGVLLNWFGRVSDDLSFYREQLAKAAQAHDPYTLDRAAKAYLIHPDAAKHRELLVQAVSAARQAVELGKDEPALAWFKLCEGLAAYRNGDDNTADAQLTDAQLPSNPLISVPALLFRAKSRLRQGRHSEAFQDFSVAKSMMPLRPERLTVSEAILQTLHDHDKMICWLAYDEAAKLFDSAAHAREPDETEE